MFQDDNEDLISSEVIWTFDDVERELLKQYPNGKALSEEVMTINGMFTWRIDLYPNGRDLKTFGKLVLSVTLIKAKKYSFLPVDAECSFSYKNKKRRKHFFGKIPLQKFTLNQTEEDTSLDYSILKEFIEIY